MCGIIGVSAPTNKENLEVLLLGLTYLHRRGPEGRGATLINSQRGTIVSAPPVNRAEDFSEFEKNVRLLSHTLDARMSLGQTRYITDERYADDEVTRANTQPIHIELDGSDMHVAHFVGVHNGNIRDKDFLAKQITAPATSPATVDSRYLIELLAQRLRESGNIWQAGTSIMGELYRIDGAASVGFSDGKQLVAFRDPRGYRPLEFGRVKDSFVFVSESGFFEEAKAIFGHDSASHIRSILPGEMLTMTGKDIKSRILVETKSTPCAFEDIYVKDHKSIDNAGRSSVLRIRENIGRQLAQVYTSELEGIDAVVPVVLSGLTYAQGFACESGIPYRNLLSKPIIRPTERYFLSVKSQRRHSFVVDSLEVKGASLAVIDDSIVRGDTIIEIYATLKDAGAARIAFFSAWPPKFFQCDYGIDTRRKELLAYELIEKGFVKYTEGKAIQYDIRDINQKLTNLIRQRVRDKYGEKYNPEDLSVFYAPQSMVQRNMSTPQSCFFCVTGQRT